VKVPIWTPPTETVPAPVVTVPTVPMNRPSWASGLTIATVSVPVSKLGLSMSAMVAAVPVSSVTAAPFSVQVALSPLRLVEVGASLTGRMVPPSTTEPAE
jgi:hypothetical protein